MAESAGVEPARPEGLAALAVRCLAARPTLRKILGCHARASGHHCSNIRVPRLLDRPPSRAMTGNGGVHGAIRTRNLRLRTPLLWSVELRGREDAKVALAAGLKPAASRLGFGRSVRLSYAS